MVSLRVYIVELPQVTYRQVALPNNRLILCGNGLDENRGPRQVAIV